MEDRELLDFAARAQGWIDYPTDSLEQGDYWHTNKDKAPFGPRFLKDVWNPLEDDGDAFRLQVEFNLEIYHSDNEGHSAVFVAYEVKGNDELQYVIEYIDDLKNLNCKLKATRRAIVRAAAEIGKKL